MRKISPAYPSKEEIVPAGCIKIATCRACRGANLRDWLDLGIQPLANAFIKTPDVVGEPMFPLDVCYCEDCGLVQLRYVVNPDLLFADYVYYSSTSPVFIKHFEDFAEKEFAFNRVHVNDLVVDIGSNDGILLRPFHKKGAQVLGIEPAKEIAAYAEREGISTIPRYFTNDLAKEIVAERGNAKLVTMTNVFAHVHDLHEIIAGVRTLLDRDGGHFVIEVPYLPEMLKRGTFDLIYHEHLSYFSLATIDEVFSYNGLRIFDVDWIPVHGGSVRVYADTKVHDPRHYPVDDRNIMENRLFKEFPSKVQIRRSKITTALKEIVGRGESPGSAVQIRSSTIIGYGAPAKMSTMLNYYGLGRETFKYVIDDSPAKQGLYTPGTHIPVRPSSPDLLKADYIFIFAWNFKDSIIEKLRALGYAGKFIIPFPHLEIV